MFCRQQRERKLDVFFPPKKAQDVHRAMVPATIVFFLAGTLFSTSRKKDLYIGITTISNTAQESDTTKVPYLSIVLYRRVVG
jgi:hypothetical protein